MSLNVKSLMMIISFGKDFKVKPLLTYCDMQYSKLYNETDFWVLEKNGILRKITKNGLKGKRKVTFRVISTNIRLRVQGKSNK